MARAARRFGSAFGGVLPGATRRSRRREPRYQQIAIGGTGRRARPAQRLDHGHRRRTSVTARPGHASCHERRAAGCRFRSPDDRGVRRGARGGQTCGTRTASRNAAGGPGRAFDHHQAARAFRTIGDLPRRRRHHRRIGRIGRGNRRRRLDPCLRHAARAGDGGLGGQRLGAHLLPQARSGTAGDRRPLQDGRGHGPQASRASRAVLARRRRDHGRSH